MTHDDLDNDHVYEPDPFDFSSLLKCAAALLTVLSICAGCYEYGYRSGLKDEFSRSLKVTIEHRETDNRTFQSMTRLFQEQQREVDRLQRQLEQQAREFE